MTYSLVRLGRVVGVVLLSLSIALAEDSTCPSGSKPVTAALNSARQNAEQLTDEYDRSDLLQHVAKNYVRNGDFKLALAVIRTDSAFMWQASDDLARYMLRCGRVSEVTAIAPTLNGRSRSLTLQWLAEWQAKHNDEAGAAVTLGTITDSDIRSDAQFNIITARAVRTGTGDTEAAFQKLLDSSPRGLESVSDLLLQDMALVDALKGDLGSAIAMSSRK